MEKVIKRKRRSKYTMFSLKQALVASLFCVPLLLIYAGVSVMSNMNPVALEMAKAKVLELTTIALNDAIQEQIIASEFTDMLNVRETGDQVYMIMANTQHMNALSTAIVANAQDKIADFGEEGVGVPIGTLTNITLLSGLGPEVYFRFTPVGGVVSTYRSELKSVGINQSLYRVNISLTALVSIILPNTHTEIKVTATAAVAESVIIGAIPQVYTNVASEDDMLNLIPTDLP